MARWALISGESGVDNAACALAVVERLQAAGVRVAGVVQRKSRNERGEKRYDLLRLRNGETAVLAVDGVAPRGPTEELFCSMTFHHDGFDAARRWIEEDAPGSDLVLLDGISKLEVSGKGHSATLEGALSLEGPVVLMGVRASQLSWVFERFALHDEGTVAAVELPADDAAIEAFARDLERSCLARRARE